MKTIQTLIKGITVLVIIGKLKLAVALVNCTGYIDFDKLLVSKDHLYIDSLLDDCFTANTYNIKQLPLEDYSLFRRLKIEYRFTLNSLLKLENAGSLSILATMGFFWFDENRLWDSSAIKMSKSSVAVSYNSIWTPNFALAQCESDPCLILPDDGSDISQQASGLTSLNMIQILHSACQMDLFKFPFDTQNCKLSFWLMHFTTMQVEMTEVNETYEFFEFFNDEWSLVSIKDYAKNFLPRYYIKLFIFRIKIKF